MHPTTTATDAGPAVAIAVARPRPGWPLVIAFDDPATAAPRWADRLALAGGDSGWITLADPGRQGFYGGIAGLGDSIEAAAGALRGLIDGLPPGRVVTLGAGVAGHAALVYGALIGADRVVAVEPMAHLIADVLEQYHDRRAHPGLRRLPDPALARRYDGAAVLERSGFRGEVHVLLGSRRVNDHADAVHLAAIHAEWLARSPRVALHRFDQLAPGLAEGGADQEPVRALLLRLLAAEGPSAAAAPPTLPAARHLPAVYTAKLTICRFEADHPANRAGDVVAFAAVGDVDPTATRKLGDELRRWIVENLLLDAAPEDLARSLLPLGISRRETLREVDLARFHPYFLATKRPLARLAKRDWLLATYRKLDRLRHRRPPGDIERRPDLAGADFRAGYYSTGRPVLLAGAVAHWPALRAWDPADLARRAGPAGAAPEAAAGRTFAADECGANVDLSADLWAGIGPLPGGFAPPDRGRAAGWFGPRGASPPPRDEGVVALVAQVVGRARVELVQPWDVDLAQDRARAGPVAANRLLAVASFPPLDQPEALEFVMDPGDLLFLPIGCRARFECLEPAAIVTLPGFDLAAADPAEGGRPS